MLFLKVCWKCTQDTHMITHYICVNGFEWCSLNLKWKMCNKTKSLNHLSWLIWYFSLCLIDLLVWKCKMYVCTMFTFGCWSRVLVSIWDANDAMCFNFFMTWNINWNEQANRHFTFHFMVSAVMAWEQLSAPTWSITPIQKLKQMIV